MWGSVCMFNSLRIYKFISFLEERFIYENLKDWEMDLLRFYYYFSSMDICESGEGLNDASQVDLVYSIWSHVLSYIESS